MDEPNRCLICGKILENPRAKYCTTCRNTVAGRKLPRIIHIRVTEKQYEFWKKFTKEQKNELTELFRKQLDLLISVEEALKTLRTCEEIKLKSDPAQNPGKTTCWQQ